MGGQKIFLILGTLSILFLVLIASGCTGSQSVTATPTPEATSTPTVTPAPASTAMPHAATSTPTPTPVPVATLFPGITPTPVPTSGYSWPGYDFHWTPQPAAPSYDDTTVLLVIDDKVENPLSLTLADLKAYPQHPASMTLDGGATISGTGPFLDDLLHSAVPEGHAMWLRIHCDEGDPDIDFGDVYESGIPVVLIIGSDNHLEYVIDGATGVVGRISNVTWIEVGGK